MYTPGSDKVVEWIRAVALLEEEERKERLLNEEDNQQNGQQQDNNQQPADQKDDKDNDEKEDDFSGTPTAFDALEKIKDIVDAHLKDPDDDKEITNILKRVRNIVGKFFESKEDQEQDQKNKDQKDQQNQQNQNQQQMPNTNNFSGQNPPQNTGANTPNDNALAMGGQMMPTPMSGGQM